MTELLLQEVGQQLAVTIKANLDDAIDAVWADSDAKDAEYDSLMDQTAITTPKVYPVSFYLGHHPDILTHPIDDYPNLTVMCYSHNPVGENLAMDQIEELANLAYVEAFVAHADASIVNRLAWRYAKALHKVVTEHKSLGGWPTIWEITRTPTVTISSSIGRRVSEWTEEMTYIQGCRMEYRFQTPQAW